MSMGPEKTDVISDKSWINLTNRGKNQNCRSKDHQTTSDGHKTVELECDVCSSRKCIQERNSQVCSIHCTLVYQWNLKCDRQTHSTYTIKRKQGNFSNKNPLYDITTYLESAIMSDMCWNHDHVWAIQLQPSRGQPSYTRPPQFTTVQHVSFTSLIFEILCFLFFLLILLGPFGQ